MRVTSFMRRWINILFPHTTKTTDPIDYIAMRRNDINGMTKTRYNTDQIRHQKLTTLSRNKPIHSSIPNKTLTTPNNGRLIFHLLLRLSLLLLLLYPCFQHRNLHNIRSGISGEYLAGLFADGINHVWHSEIHQLRSPS